MLIEFRVANFLSFEDIATFSMEATTDKEHEKSNVISLSEKQRLLKSAAIYGANGAGKSNLIKAMSFMKAFVRNSVNHSTGGFLPDHTFKLNLQSAKKPSFFEVTFIQDKTRFRYGFEADKHRIVSEWLYHTPKTKEVMLFIREDDAVTVGPSYKEARSIEGSVKKEYRDRLFLTLVAAANEERVLADSVIAWFRLELDVTYGSALMHNLEMTLHYLEEHPNDHYLEKFTKLFRKLDIFDEFYLDEKSTMNLYGHRSLDDEAIRFDSHDHKRVVVQRRVYDGDRLVGPQDFDLMRDESDGTKKLFAFIGAVIVNLEQGGVLVVDELELKLHPLITKTIIELFNSASNTKAQLIFTSHDTNLLSNRFFRRDQIWFTEKNERGSSKLYSLVEYKPRKDATYNKDYILGKYGAVPFVGNIDALGWNE